MLFEVVFFIPLLFINLNAEPEIILVAEIPGEMQVGRVLKLEGTVIDYSDRFCSINLQHGQGYKEGDIGLHISIRKEFKQIVIASFQEGKWMDEKTYENYPIDETGKFLIEITATIDNFEISINDESYTFQIPFLLYHLTHLLVEGDVRIELTEWSFNNPRNENKEIPSEDKGSSSDYEHGPNRKPSRQKVVNGPY